MAHPFALGTPNFRLHAADDIGGDVVLQIEDIDKFAVVTFGPQMLAADRVNELCGYSNPVAATSGSTNC